MGLAARDVLMAGAPIALATVTLVPIVRTRVSVVPMGGRVTANASSALSALVIRERAGDRVLDCEDGERALETLRESVVGLVQVLDG